MQARPASAGEGRSKAAAQEAALAAVEEEWSARLAEALALCQDQEAALAQLQAQCLKDCRLPFLTVYSKLSSPQAAAGAEPQGLQVAPPANTQKTFRPWRLKPQHQGS